MALCTIDCSDEAAILVDNVEIVIRRAIVEVSFAIPTENVVITGQWTWYENVPSRRRVETGVLVKRLGPCKQGACNK